MQPVDGEPQPARQLLGVVLGGTAAGRRNRVDGGRTHGVETGVGEGATSPLYLVLLTNETVADRRPTGKF
jgi:hypothetical protein